MLIDIWESTEKLQFFATFFNRGHDENKVLDETMIKLSHVIENLNVFRGFLFRHAYNGCNFLKIR
jgi:hypothetical protein